jgi:hypothetical protein
MTGAQFRLKQATGWFAAGKEVAQALAILPDGAFKLFMWMCLNADRGLGIIRVEPGEMARSLGKTETEICANLRDLFQAEIACATANGAIQIADRYWPYDRVSDGQNSKKLVTYISQLKRAFLERRCVRSAFTAADEKIAVQLFHAGLPIADAENAILLGSLRKYIALLNNGEGTPITSLRYFATMFGEVKQDIPPSYWEYVRRKVRDAERQWSGFPVSATQNQTK